MVNIHIIAWLRRAASGVANLTGEVSDARDDSRRDPLRSDAAHPSSVQQSNEVDLAPGTGCARFVQQRTEAARAAGKALCRPLCAASLRVLCGQERAWNAGLGTWRRCRTFVASGRRLSSSS